LKSCNKLFVDYVESEGLEPLLDIIENLGDWPMASDSWKEEEFNWQKAIAELNRHFGLSPLISLIVYLDRKNSTQSVITVSHIFWAEELVTRLLESVELLLQHTLNTMKPNCGYRINHYVSEKFQ
jgi:hypothetical protein